MSFDTKLTAEVRKQLEDRIVQTRENIADGICKSWEEYLGSRLYIKGLRDAIAIMQQTSEDLMKGDDK